MGSYPLSSLAPTQVEVELGCDKKINVLNLVEDLVGFDKKGKRDKVCNFGPNRVNLLPLGISGRTLSLSLFPWVTFLPEVVVLGF